MITITPDDVCVELGELVQGSLRCDGADVGGPVHVRLRWWTAGRGSADGRTVAEADVPLEGQPDGSATAAFALVADDDHPCSYEGTLLQVRWAVEARSVTAEGSSAREPVIVAPRRGRAVWQRWLSAPTG